MGRRDLAHARRRHNDPIEGRTMIERAIPSSRPIQAMMDRREPANLCSQQHGLTSPSPSTTGAQPDRR